MGGGPKKGAPSLGWIEIKKSHHGKILLAHKGLKIKLAKFV